MAATTTNIQVVDTHNPYVFQACTWHIANHVNPANLCAAVWNARESHATVILHALGEGIVAGGICWKVEDFHHQQQQQQRRLFLSCPSASIATAFIQEALQAYRMRMSKSKMDGGISFFTYEESDGIWQLQGVAPKRPLESLFLPTGIAQSIVEDVQTFLTHRSKYEQLHIPMIRTYMFHGVPGSGKSALVHCLASLCSLNVARFSGTSAEELGYAVHRVPPSSVLAIDDIDSLLKGGRESGGFAGFLQALDGVARAEPLLVFMTSNVPGQLDIAVRRRIDYSIEFKSATKEQCRDMAAFFYPSESAHMFEALWKLLQDNRPFPCSAFHKLLIRSLGCEGGPLKLLESDPQVFSTLVGMGGACKSSDFMYS